MSESIIIDWTKYNSDTTTTFSLKGTECYGRVVQIHDGDTITVIIPLFDTNKFYKFSVRLSGIDTCEVSSTTEENKILAINAKNKLIELVTSTNNNITDIKSYLHNNITLVYLKCLDFDKYGRLLATIYKNKNDEISFSDILIKEKLGYCYTGKKKLTELEQLELLKK